MNKADIAHARFMEERAKLQRAAEHWQNDLAYGRGDWEGDRALVLYYKPLTHTMEVWYELPNNKPVLVIGDIDAATFDISKLCAALAYADNRKVSVEDKIAAADAHNDAIKAAEEAESAEKQEEFIDKMHWSVRKDTGQHISPIVVPRVLD